MNIVNILDQIEKVDNEVVDKLNPRRAAMKGMLSFGKKAAVAAVPFGLGSMFSSSTASAQTSGAGVVDALQFVLALKHFESALITQGLSKVKYSSPNTTGDVAALNTMKDQTNKHITFLKNAITAAGATPVSAKTNYDFTGGGAYSNVMSSTITFLKVVQGVKDATVRAIKGQAPALVKQGDTLAAALAMHAVDARHAAKLRIMRLFNGYSAPIKPWTSERDLTENEAIGKDVFIGEDVTTQAGVDTSKISGVTHAQATEAFDEPLTKAQVTAALAPFKIF